MNKIKKLGVWMDHTHAHITAFSLQEMKTKIIESKSRPANDTGIHKSEKNTHNNEQQIESQFFDALFDEIKLYDEVLLFGPTEAKTELLNCIRKDHQFDQIQIHVVPCDHLTENQEHAYIKDYFSQKSSPV